MQWRDGTANGTVDICGCVAGHALLRRGYPQPLRPVVAQVRRRWSSSPSVPRARQRLPPVDPVPQRGALPPGVEIRRRAVRPGEVTWKRVWCLCCSVSDSADVGCCCGLDDKDDSDSMSYDQRETNERPPLLLAGFFHGGGLRDRPTPRA